MTQTDANQKALEALAKLLDSKDDGIRLSAARTILESETWTQLSK